MGHLLPPYALLQQALGYPAEELADLDAELSRLDVRELTGRLLEAREELARDLRGA